MRATGSTGVSDVRAERTAAELVDANGPAPTHDSSTNALMQRYRMLREEST